MFVVATSLRTALRKSPHCKLVPSPLSQFCAPHFTFMSTSLAPNVKRPFDESSTSVQINDKEDGEEFVCDEEPHMLSPEQGFGYYPITLGQKLGEDPRLLAQRSDPKMTILVVFVLKVLALIRTHYDRFG